MAGAAIKTYQVGADFRFEFLSRILYKIGELGGETERIVVLLTIFRRNGYIGVNTSVIPVLTRPALKAVCI